MKKKIKIKEKVVTVITTLLFTRIISCPLVFALDLQTAKQQGLVGKTIGGYLKSVKPSPEVEKLVNYINNKRKEQYLKISDKRGGILEYC